MKCKKCGTDWKWPIDASACCAKQPKQNSDLSVLYSGRSLGKSYANFARHIAVVKSGVNSVIFGDGYVVISRKEYERLKRNDRQ